MPKLASFEKRAPNAASPRSAKGGGDAGRFGFGFPAVREVLPLRFRTAVQRPVVPAVTGNYRPRCALRFGIVPKKITLPRSA